jgi:hypothetical protein
MNLLKRAKKGNYPKLNIGDDVRVPVIHKQHEGYQDSFSIEIHQVEDKDKGLHQVDGTFHPRKDLQLVKGNTINASTKTKAQQVKYNIQNKVGKSLKNPEVKDLVGVRTKQETKEILESGRTYLERGRNFGEWFRRRAAGTAGDCGHAAGARSTEEPALGADTRSRPRPRASGLG